MFDEERYVISSVSEDEPVRYRLLATGKKGAKVVWASVGDLEKMDRYTGVVDDTARY